MGVGAVGKNDLNRLIQVAIDQNRTDKVSGHPVRHPSRYIHDNVQLQNIVFPVCIPGHLVWYCFEIDLVVRNKQKRACDDKCKARIINRLIPEKRGIFLVLKNNILLFVRKTQHAVRHANNLFFIYPDGSESRCVNFQFALTRNFFRIQLFITQLKRFRFMVRQRRYHT